MPPKDKSKDGAIPRVRVPKDFEDITRECAKYEHMDLAEYIRAAVREKNKQVLQDRAERFIAQGTIDKELIDELREIGIYLNNL